MEKTFVAYTLKTGHVVCQRCADWILIKPINHVSKIYEENLSPFSQWCHYCGKIVFRGPSPTQLFDPPKETWELFDEVGRYIGPEFPRDAVNECSSHGQVRDAVEHWVKRLQFTVPRDMGIAYLTEYGAWDDLETIEPKTMAQRVFWLACNDIKEQGEWVGLN